MSKRPLASICPDEKSGAPSGDTGKILIGDLSPRTTIKLCDIHGGVLAGGVPGCESELFRLEWPQVHLEASGMMLNGDTKVREGKNKVAERILHIWRGVGRK